MNKEHFVTAELANELSNVPLKVSGIIPEWLCGTLIRNGPININVNGKCNAHWFDGLAMLHAFSFNKGNVRYSNKFLRTDAYATVFQKGSINYQGFAVDPCRSIFKRFFTLFKSHSNHALNNANVNVTKIAHEYLALTEIPLPVKFDPVTLSTLGVFEYEDELPKDRCWESAHPHYDTKRKELINYLVKFKKESCYTVYKIKDESSTREIIAEIPVERPSYMHSFAITKNYIILTEFPLLVKPIDFLIKGKAFIKNYQWDDTQGTQFLVIHRHNGSVIKFTTDAFFAFHHANAFEEDSKIHLDIVSYDNADIITSHALETRTHPLEPNKYHTRLMRYSLCLTARIITHHVLSDFRIEFPRINDRLDGYAHHHVYATGFVEDPRASDAVLQSNALYKINTSANNSFETWAEEGCMPGEPVFVSSPNAQNEDEGVILAVVLDSKQYSSFLLILDAKNFKEIARIHAPHPIPQGLHGQFFNRPLS